MSTRYDLALGKPLRVPSLPFIPGMLMFDIAATMLATARGVSVNDAKRWCIHIEESFVRPGIDRVETLVDENGCHLVTLYRTIRSSENAVHVAAEVIA